MVYRVKEITSLNAMKGLVVQGVNTINTKKQSLNQIQLNLF